MATCYYQIIFKGNEAYICVDFPDSGFTNLTSTFFTDGENVVVGTPYVLEDGVMTFHFSPDDFDIINDGVIRYIIEYKVDGEDKMLSTNSNAYLKTLSDFSGKTKEDYWEDGYASGYTKGQEECSGGSEDLIANLQGDYFVIPEGTTKLRDYAFYECRSISAITIPDSVEYIGNHAFLGTSMSSITIPDSVSGMGDEVFGNSGFKEVSIGSGITKLPNGTFYYDSQLYSVSLPSGITEIGEKCFFRCQSLSSITLPEAVTKIGQAAFKHCSGLTEVILPYGLTGIQRDCFTNCVSLTGMNFPSTIQTIGDTCFSNCMSLTEMTFEGAVPPVLDSKSGLNASLGSTDYTFPFWVPCDSYDAYVQAFGPAYAPRVMCAEG